MSTYARLMFEALGDANLPDEFWLSTYRSYYPKRGGKISVENARWCVLNKLGTELNQ